MEPHLGCVEQSFDLRYSSWVREALNELPDCFTITNPCISGHPIIFASTGFLEMVGYSRDEVIGKNGRIFQGPETDRRSVLEIREAIMEEKAVEVKLLNYRKDGSPFWMLFQMCPVFSKEDGKVINFVGVQVPLGRKMRVSKNGTNLCEDGDSMHNRIIRGCRREARHDSILELGCGSTPDDDNREFDVNKPCEVSVMEKTKATAAIGNILSVLTHYSKLTGRVACRKRCCLSGNVQLSVSLNISLGRIKQSFVLTDALLPDMPIVYASEAFFKLTGYTASEVLGQNCRFLSGTDTDPRTQFQIKESIQKQQACTVHILNYRKDRTPFWNFLHISPVRDASAKIAFFVGVQLEEDDCKQQEMCGLSPEMRQLSVVGAVKVGVRGWSMRNC